MKKGTLDTAAVTSPPGKGVHASDPRPQEDSEVEACTGSLKFQVSLINLVNSYLKLKKKKKKGWDVHQRWYSVWPPCISPLGSIPNTIQGYKTQFYYSPRYS